MLDDPTDPRVAAYLNIRERDLVGRRDHFVVEGEVVLRALLLSPRHRPVSLLIAASRVPSLTPLLSGVPAEVPIFIASQAVLDAIAGFHLHRGVLALGRRKALPSLAGLLPQGRPVAPGALFVVLVGIANHDNMGGILRNAAAFGATAAILDPTSCDPFYRKAIRVSAGAVLNIPIARALPDEDILAAFAAAGVRVLGFATDGQLALEDIDRTGPLALAFGSEGAGLPRSFLRRVETVRIPMADGIDSLNVATASGIALHHARLAWVASPVR
ncbi:MAG: RNA methyltransferase [Bauldia sp.]